MNENKGCAFSYSRGCIFTVKDMLSGRDANDTKQDILCFALCGKDSTARIATFFILMDLTLFLLEIRVDIDKKEK